MRFTHLKLIQISYVSRVPGFLFRTKTLLAERKKNGIRNENDCDAKCWEGPRAFVQKTEWEHWEQDIEILILPSEYFKDAFYRDSLILEIIFKYKTKNLGFSLL